MTQPERNALINSSLARIISALLTTVIHELGHFFVSIALGNSATLHHNHVETHNENLDFINQLLIPIGGPVVSLVQGVLCMHLYRKIKNSVGSLLTLWLGISGLMAFFGYMMIAPFSTVGDTGKIFQLLEIPMFWQVLISIVALIVFTLLLFRFHMGFEQFIPESIAEGQRPRAKWAKLLIMYPLLIGILINTVMQFPVVHFLSLLPSLMMPFALFMVYGQMIMSKNTIAADKNWKIIKFSKTLLIVFIASVLIYRVLVAGLTF